MKDRFFKKILIVFHYEFVSPKTRTRTFMTSTTACGGFGKDASSLRFFELIPETDFLAYSIRGWTSDNSD